MQSCVPSLSLDGWVTNKRMIFYKIWEYFLVAEYSQTDLFKEKMASAKYIIGTQQSNVAIVADFEKYLRELYKNYFDEVTVDAFILPSEGGLQVCSISIICYDNDDPDTKYILNRDIKYTNGEIYKLEELLTELYRHYTV